jgi:hypothetical protein
LGVASATDEIRVAQGVYKPAAPGGDRAVSFVVVEGTTLMGGYAGVGAPDPDARDVEQFPTILSGDLNSNDGPNFANTSENSFHVLVVSGLSAATTVDGFTIQGGNANSATVPHDRGGGLLNIAGSPLVSRCTFTLNQAPLTASGFGGGVYNASSNAVLTGCIFTGNSARRGGGVFNDGGQPQILGSWFTENSALLGAGVRNNASDALLANCLFTANSGGTHGGGIYNIGTSSPQVINCTFVSNGASSAGAGILSTGAGGAVNCLVTNCIVWQNAGSEISNFDGGGVNTVSYSNVEGGFAGTGNINSNPMFVNSAGDDYRLQSNSPCIDRGNNFAVPLGVTTDFNGYPRLWDDPVANAGNPPGPGAIVDMGAHERIPDGLFIGQPGGSWFVAAAWPTASLPSSATDVLLNVQVLVDQLGAVAGDVSILPGGELLVGGEFEGMGGSLEVADALTVEPGGTLTLGNNSSVAAAEIIVQSGGTLNMTAPTALLSVGDMTMDAGSILNWTAGTIAIDGGTWSNPVAATIDVGCDSMAASLHLLSGASVSAATLNICADGALEGDGSVNAALVNGGVVRPGEGVGTLIAGSSYAQSANGELALDVGGLAAGTQHDVLTVVGAAALDGEASVNLVNGFVPQPGDDFEVLTAGSLAGEFTGVVGSPTSCGKVFGASYTATAASIETLYDPQQPDCNNNGVPDACDILNQTSPDCNANSIPDECDILNQTSPDCNANNIPDECDIAGNPSIDCNLNGIPDSCDLASGFSVDLNNNSIPDDCENCDEGDYNCSGSVDVDDLIGVILAWGVCLPNVACPGDVAPHPNGDGQVNVDDLIAVILNWG